MTVSGDRRAVPLAPPRLRGSSRSRPWLTGRCAPASSQRAAAALQDRADPGHHLARAERLHDIIVAAQLEPEHPVDLVVARGEEQDRQVAVGAQPAADVEPVHPRHVDVEHDEVGPLRRDRAERASPSAASVVCIPALPSAKASTWRICGSSSTIRIVWLIAYISFTARRRCQRLGAAVSSGGARAGSATRSAALVGGAGGGGGGSARPSHWRFAAGAAGASAAIARRRRGGAASRRSSRASRPGSSREPRHDPAAQPAGRGRAVGRQIGRLSSSISGSRAEGPSALQIAEVERGAAAADLAGVAHVPGGGDPRRDRRRCRRRARAAAASEIGVDQPGAAPAAQQAAADQRPARPRPAPIQTKAAMRSRVSE